MDNITIKEVSFRRDGLELKGNLILPADFDSDKKYNAIIVQGSATSVKEQMSGLYGRKFAEEGFIALGFDYCHYGQSQGEPRQYEDYNEKLRDLMASVTYLLSLSYVKNVAMVGICTSGGNMPYLAALDKRIKVAASVAGYFTSPEILKALFGKEIFDVRIAAADEAFAKYQTTGEQTIITTYSETDPSAANYLPIPGVFDYYLNPNRGGVPSYNNGLNVQSFIPFYGMMDPFTQAANIECPIIMVHSDGCTNPKEARKFFDMLTCEKKLAWEGGGMHFDYYDQPAQVDYSVREIVDFFRKHMP